jgi:hypothetical protein
MTKLAFVMRGPQGGQILHMAEEDFSQAIDDGWVVDFETANKGGDPDPFKGWNKDPHDKAEAYLYRAAGGTYATREMKSDPPKAKPASEDPQPVKIKPRKS